MFEAISRTAFPPVPGPARARPFPWPWRDRAGRFSALRAATLGLLAAPAIWVLGLACAEALGPEPIKAATKEIGLWCVRFLLLALAVTPLARLLAEARLAALRRMIGLGVLAYGLLHLLLYCWLEGWGPLHIAAEIALRFYLTVGFVALLGLAVLGWTSTDGWMRKLGSGWKRLHRLVWPIAALAVLHFFLQSKSLVWEAVIAAGIFAWLGLWRLLPATRRIAPLWLLALAPAAAVAAALAEYAFFALATRLPAERILAANLDWAMAPRPAAWVLLGALVLPLALQAGGRLRR